MLTIKQCRALIEGGDIFSDRQIEKIRDTLQDLAGIALDQYFAQAKPKKKHVHAKQLLQKDKKGFIERTLSATELKKEYGLKDEDLEVLPVHTKYGKPRYSREQVAIYLRIKHNKQLSQNKLL